MTTIYKIARKLGQWPALLVCLLLFNAYQSWGQTPYPLASGTYTENFDNISGWTNNFASGLGANRFGVASPNPTLPTTNTVFVTNTAGGVQKGTAAIVLLATGATGGQNASAFDLYLDFSNSTAGTISLDYAEVNNSTGDRQATFKLQTNTGTSGSFVDLPGSSVVITNNVAASGSLTSIALPAAFTNNPSAKVRFFVITSSNGTTGSRPKVSLDNVVVTAGGGTTPTPTAAISTTSGAYTSPYCITSTAGSTTFNVAFSSSNVATGSTFSAQLSNASGVFLTDLTQNLIGSGTSSPIAASIPKNTPSGTGYRIRVVSGTLASANDNGTNLTLTLAPTTNPVTLSSTAAQTFATNTSGTALTATASVSSAYAWYYSTSAGGPYTTAVSGATAATYQPKGSDFPSAGTYYLVAQATSSCGSVVGTSAPVQLTIVSAAAAFTPSVTGLPDFGSLAVGSTSTSKSFTVSATTLSGPLFITPPTGFEIRTGATAFACCPLQLTPDANGNVSATTIEVRFAPLAAQAYSAQVALTTSGLPEQDVAVTGTGTTPIYPAAVASLAPTNVGKTFATAGGNVLEEGGSPVTVRGVVFGYEPDPTLSSSSVAAGSGPGTFSAQLTGLLPDSVYYVRAYATNSLGTSYGEQFTFTTLAQPLDAEPTTASTIAASNQRPTRVLLTLSGGQPGVKHLVLARLNGPVTVKPRDATAYSANAVFGQGQQLGTASYVVLAAAQDTVTVRGLRPNTPYSFAVYDYTDLSGTPYAQNYLTSAADSLTLTTPALPPTLLLREDFEYAAGTALTANGWTAHSPGANAVSVTATSPAYAGYSDGKGNAAALRASGEDVSRQFSTIYPRTAVYLSFVVTVSSVNTTGDYFLHLGPTTLGSNFRPRVFVRQAATGNAIQFGVSDNGAAAYTTATYSLNTPCLLLVKYNFDETGTTTELYVNPDPQSSTIYRVSATPDVSVATNTSPTDIGTLALRQGSSSPALVVDDIQLATAFPLSTTPLPVTLTKFTARASGRTVQLAWQTASEVNSDHFVVERSLDGRTFAPLQSVPAAGSSTTPRTYTALDAQAQATGASQLYYRLRSVDHDGTSTYSATQIVALTPAAAGLALFPNPTTTAATTLVGASAGARVQVIDALGRTVMTTTADATGAAELKLPTGVASGVYVVRTGTQALRLLVK